MTVLNSLQAAGLAVFLAGSATAKDSDALTATDDVHAEISEAMDAIAAYSAQERDEALTEARGALDRLDAGIDRREGSLRENWAEMSTDARETAEARLRDLRQARNRLGERYGALETGASAAWGDLQSGFSDAWGSFSDAWSAADEDASTN